MNSNLFIQGISRVLNCPKVHVAVTGLATTWFAVRYAAADLPPTQRAALWVAFIGAAAVQLREIINSWSEEDVANVNRETDRETERQGDREKLRIRFFLQLYPSPHLSVPLSRRLPALFPESQFNTRSPDMPSRTKLPLVLVGFSLITLFAASGCQSPPELAVYREGLHQVDEPLYQAHLLLMDDAVTANIRSDSDRQVVQQGIAAARALYQQSVAAQAAGAAAPTTAPSK